MHKFQIVRDWEDLVSGDIIPRKVLGSMPVSIGGPGVGFGFSIGSPVFKPIEKYPGLVISPQSPSLSPLSLSSPTSFAKMGKSGPEIYPMAAQPTRYLGPPLLKWNTLSSLGYVDIQINYDGKMYPIRVPAFNARNFITDLYRYELSEDELKNIQNTVSFKIITPSWTGVVRTSPDRMTRLLQRIKYYYPSTTYLLNGNYVNINRLPIYSQLNLI